MKIFYLAPIRIPSEKAHTYHIVKMCEALAQNNEVSLIVGYRRNRPELKGIDIFKYYDVERNFVIRRIIIPDFIWLNKYLPSKLHYINVLIYTIIFALISIIYCHNDKVDLVITRDSRVAYMLSYFFDVIYDVHAYSRGKLERYIERRAYGRCRLLTATTAKYKEEYVRQGYEADRIKVLPNGVDLKKYDIRISKEAARRELGWDEDKKIIGYVGNFLTLGMEKGLIEVIRSVKYIKVDNFKVVMVGGPMEAVDRYKHVIREEGLNEGLFEFIDRVEHSKVPLILKAFDCCLMPFPWNEHYAYYMCPLKMFEYMASGRAIIATDLPSVREILDDESALMVGAGDVRALGEAIERVLMDEGFAKRIGENAYKKVAEYTWERRAKKLLEYYYQSIQNRQLVKQ